MRTRYKTKTLRNLKVSEIVHLCRTHECYYCPLIDFCVNFDYKDYEHIEMLYPRKIHIKYVYRK